MTDQARTIPIEGSTKRFYQGVSAGKAVQEVIATSGVADLDAQRAFFWLYVGAKAVAEFDLAPEQFEEFVAGAKLREPREPDHGDEDMRLVDAGPAGLIWLCGNCFHEHYSRRRVESQLDDLSTQCSECGA